MKDEELRANYMYMEKYEKTHERARNRENGEKIIIFYDFLKKKKGSIFFTKIGGQNICLVHIPLNFSIWKELDSVLNVGRWNSRPIIWKNLKGVAKGPQIVEMVKNSSF